MLAHEALQAIFTYWPALLVTIFAARLLFNKFHNGLNKYPGHWLAAYTDWWRFADVRNRSAHETHIELHRKYGDVVRLGPNVLSFADPRAIKIIYGLNKGMTKSDFCKGRQGALLLNITDCLMNRSSPAGSRKRRASAVAVQHKGRRVPCDVQAVHQQRVCHVLARQL